MENAKPIQATAPATDENKDANKTAQAGTDQKK